MHSFLKLALCATALNATLALAAEPQANPSAGAQQITRAGDQPSAAGPAEFFTGR